VAEGSRPHPHPEGFQQLRPVRQGDAGDGEVVLHPVFGGLQGEVAVFRGLLGLAGLSVLPAVEVGDLLDALPIGLELVGAEGPGGHGGEERGVVQEGAVEGLRLGQPFPQGPGLALGEAQANAGAFVFAEDDGGHGAVGAQVLVGLGAELVAGLGGDILLAALGDGLGLGLAGGGDQGLARGEGGVVIAEGRQASRRVGLAAPLWAAASRSARMFSMVRVRWAMVAVPVLSRRWIEGWVSVRRLGVRWVVLGKGLIARGLLGTHGARRRASLALIGRRSKWSGRALR